MSDVNENGQNGSESEVSSEKSPRINNIQYIYHNVVQLQINLQ